MTVERIEFTVDGDQVVGELHLPGAPGPYPAVVVAGPMTSVKEQVTGVYAAALAARGVAALSLDHRGYGESEGRPRQYEHHRRKVADLTVALDWLTGRADLASDRIGLAGICLGGGYAVTAAAGNPIVKAIGTVAGYYRDPAAMRAADPEGFDAKVAEGRIAREHYEATGELETIPAVALDGDAAMQTPDTYDYYARRAAIPNYTNAFAVMSREHFVPFDVQAAAPRLTAPIAMVHSENALSPHWARQFHAAVNASKSLYWLISSGQTDFYDNLGLVAAAADRLAAHFHAHLG
jgi:hypothetical protein